MGINIKAIRKGVEKGIKLNPTHITLIRDNLQDDGYNGKIPDYDRPYLEVATMDIFLNDGTSSLNDTRYSDGGRRARVSGVTALILYSDDYEVKEGDFFDFSGKRYIIEYPLNMYNAYWSVGLEVKSDGNK